MTNRAPSKRVTGAPLISKAAETFDAVVVGSGANGGWVAKLLAEAGLSVCVLEKGEPLDPKVDFTEHMLPHDFELRGKRDPRNEALKRRPVQSKCYACGESNAHFFEDEIDNPVTTPDGRDFWWVRGNKVGGRTLMWARQSYRMSDWDFKAASRDGFGVDWPIAYADLAPYYDIVERYIGVSGRREGIDVLPDGQFLPPMAYTCGELDLKAGLEKIGRRMTIGRAAVLTRNHNGRLACHYCGPCHRGCRTGSYFTSPGSTLLDAERTGRYRLIPHAHVRQVNLDGGGLARGVAYVDTSVAGGTEREVKAKIVVLAASTLGSTRILLNSPDADRGSEGLANSSGALGCYLMDHHFQRGAQGVLPARGRKPELARRPNGIYIPRFKNLGVKEPSYLRAYGYQGGENVTSFEHAYGNPGFGAEWKHLQRSAQVSHLSIEGYGEMLPRRSNRVSLDPMVTDKWGVPVLHIDCAWSDNEKRMSIDMANEAQHMLEAAGVEEVEQFYDPAPPGWSIHEVGTARMGTDRKNSVVNAFQQTHDVKNLFVMDGSSFVSSGCVNPTLTMMALTVRSCKNLVAEHAAGRLA